MPHSLDENSISIKVSQAWRWDVAEMGVFSSLYPRLVTIQNMLIHAFLANMCKGKTSSGKYLQLPESSPGSACRGFQAADVG